MITIRIDFVALGYTREEFTRWLDEESVTDHFEHVEFYDKELALKWEFTEQESVAASRLLEEFNGITLSLHSAIIVALLLELEILRDGSEH